MQLEVGKTNGGELASSFEGNAEKPGSSKIAGRRPVRKQGKAMAAESGKLAENWSMESKASVKNSGQLKKGTGQKEAASNRAGEKEKLRERR